MSRQARYNKTNNTKFISHPRALNKSLDIDTRCDINCRIPRNFIKYAT